MREKFASPATRLATGGTMRGTVFRIAVVALLLIAAPALLDAQRANLRLGTILPANSAVGPRR